MEQIARDARELASIARMLTMIGLSSPQLDAMVHAGTATSNDIVALKSTGPAARGTLGQKRARRDAILDDLAVRLDAVVAPRIAA